jgi:hypothetical protein
VLLLLLQPPCMRRARTVVQEAPPAYAMALLHAAGA